MKVRWVTVLAATLCVAASACSTTAVERSAGGVDGGTNSPDVASFLNVNWAYQGNIAPGVGTAFAASGSPGVILSFIGSAGPGSCVPVFLSGDNNISPTSASTKSFVKEIEAAGSTVSFAFGGQYGAGFLQQTCTDPTQLLSALNVIADTYPEVDSWLWDLEGGVESDTASDQRLMNALVAVRKTHNIDMTMILPVAETGLVGGLVTINSAKSAGLPVAVDIMCQGFSPTPKNEEQACENAANATQSQLKTIYPQDSDSAIWSRMALTLQIGKQPNSNPTVTVQDMKNLRSFAIAKGVGAINNWSLNQDFAPASSGDASRPSVWVVGSSGAPDQTADWQFTAAASGK